MRSSYMRATILTTLLAVSGIAIGAAQAAGFALNEDYNGAVQDGFSRMQMTIRRGRRESAATAYLHPVLARPNLTIAVQAHATAILFDDQRAPGVAYLQDGQRHVARAAREVIVSAGAINSPQLLQLSGIGDPATLRALGIGVRAALPF